MLVSVVSAFFPSFRDYVLDMVAAEKKFLIFAHHQEMLDSIEEAVAGVSIIVHFVYCVVC